MRYLLGGRGGQLCKGAPYSNSAHLTLHSFSPLSCAKYKLSHVTFHLRGTNLWHKDENLLKLKLNIISCIVWADPSWLSLEVVEKRRCMNWRGQGGGGTFQKSWLWEKCRFGSAVEEKEIGFGYILDTQGLESEGPSGKLWFWGLNNSKNEEIDSDSCDNERRKEVGRTWDKIQGETSNQ